MSVRDRQRWLATAGCVALVGAAAAFTLIEGKSAARAAEEARRNRPIELAGEGYVSSRECRSCHPQQYQSWHASYHRTMTQPANPETVFGAFDGRTLERSDGSHTLHRRGDDFWITIDDARGVREQKVALVTGRHHLQIYWQETGRQRELVPLAFAWLMDEQRFIPREAAFLRPPAHGRAPETGRWNTTCITCHTTNGVPKRDERGEFDTHVAEFGIACEACHGPGRDHVRANAGPLDRYLRRVRGADDTIVHPAKLGHRQVSELCGQCHGVWQFRNDAEAAKWNDSGFAYRPGDDAHATQVLFQPSLRDREPLVDMIMSRMPGYTSGIFWSDGMARVSGREFSAMYESPCYQRGEMSCLSCHSMHKTAEDPRSAREWADDQLGVGMDGDEACTSCHAEMKSKLTEHTQHAATSAGSRCYNCHMPHTTYGLLKAIRSHQVSSPDAGTSARTGRPNACNLCHLDRSLQWTAEQLQRRFGIAAPELAAPDRELSAALRWTLSGDAGQRALLAWGLGWEPARRAAPGDYAPMLLGVLLDDPYDAVRIVAARSLRGIPGFEGFEYDSTPAPSSRPSAAERVFALLAQRRPERANGGARPELLLGADGAFDRERIAQLLRARDDRPINLLE